MKDLVEGVIRLLEQKESFALATIVKQRGSAPRDSGAHMAIRADGGILGTIGGGLLEALVQQHAVHVLQEHKMHVLELNLTCRQAAQMDMICGGQVEVLIDFIDVQEAGYLDIYRGILSSSKSGQRAWLVTSLSPNESVCRTRQCLVKNSSEIIGWEGCPSGDLESLLPQMPNIRSFTVFDDLQLMIEPLGCSGTTYVFGGGHIAHKLVPLLNMVEFATVVVDDRVEYANIERFTTADQIIVSDFTSVFNELDIDEQSYIIIITRGHMHDQQVLAQALRSKVAYIGMIGSHSKRDSIYRSLMNEGFSSGDLQQVYSPIGLSIGADTPEEIAISITAELIKVRAGRRRESQSIC